MDLKARVQGILLRPKEEWEKIKPESYSVSQLFTSYVLILAAVPALGQFIGSWLIGYRVPFYGWYRFGLGTALLRAILFYGLTVVSVYVLGIVINAMAGTFSSRSDQLSAMKLAAFSLTPGWVAGVLHIIPTLGILASLAAIYGIYLMYLGLNAGLMETPSDKVATYLVAIVVVTVVIMVVITVLLSTIFAVGVGMRAI
jgi:peptidoglycan biosynthesis protein MviN/MurJ (putative lipid II flippase)